jgi:hypothetical protein
VLEYHLKPGEKEAMHSHPPGVVYSLNDATIQITLPDGTSSETAVTQGEVFWREFTRHAGENNGRAEVHTLVIDLKSPIR